MQNNNDFSHVLKFPSHLSVINEVDEEESIYDYSKTKSKIEPEKDAKNVKENLAAEMVPSKSLPPQPAQLTEYDPYQGRVDFDAPEEPEKVGLTDFISDVNEGYVDLQPTEDDNLPFPTTEDPNGEINYDNLKDVFDTLQGYFIKN